MQGIKITVPAEDGHYHLVYINTETGQAAVAPARDGHTHQIMYDPPREPVQPTEAVPPQVDPMTGQPVMVQDPQTGQMMPDPGQPANPGDPGKEVGEWILAPGDDGHQHIGLADVPKKAKSKEKKETDHEVIQECLKLWEEGLGIVKDSVKKGEESEDFYKGKQWPPEMKRAIEADDRAALVLNEVAPQIDTLIGYQMEQRTDIKYLPQEGGDQRVADMLNIVTKKILDNCYFPREETKVFKDECIPGFGVFNVYMDFNSFLGGDIRVERFPWKDIVYGAHDKEDLSDCEYEVRHRMHSVAHLKMLFGKKADKIEEGFNTYRNQYPDIKKLEDSGVNGTNTDYRSAEKLTGTPFTVGGNIPLVDVQRKQFRLVQCTRKTYKEVTVIFNQEENYFLTAYDWEDKDISAASELPGFQVITQVKPRMRVTKFCGNVLLSDENPADLPVQDFFTVPVYAYRQNGEFWGKVEAAKDPQREINKRRSQVMDTMNRLAAAVVFTEHDMFAKENGDEDFERRRAKPGAIFKLNNLDRRPTIDQGAQLPAPLVQIMQMDQDNLQRLMNVVIEPGGANESGVLFLERKKGRLAGNQILFENMSFAKQRLGRLLLPLIQRYYEPERLYRLLNSQYTKQKFKIGDTDFSQFSKQEILEMLEEADLLAFDVVVSESSFSPTTRMGIAMALMDLMKQGAQIPIDLPLEFMDIPADIKANISERMQQESEAAAASQADTSNTEVIKTVLGKGEYTISPEKAQELGLVPAGNNGSTNAEQTPNNVDNQPQDTKYINNLASALAG